MRQCNTTLYLSDWSGFLYDIVFCCLHMILPVNRLLLWFWLF